MKQPNRLNQMRELDASLERLATQAIENSWDDLIARAEDKWRRARRRADQLEALVSDFKRRKHVGDPTPFEIAKAK